MLRAIGQDKPCRLPLIGGTLRSQTHREQKKNGGCQGLGGRGNGSYCVVGIEVRFYKTTGVGKDGGGVTQK